MNQQRLDRFRRAALRRQTEITSRSQQDSAAIARRLEREKRNGITAPPPGKHSGKWALRFDDGKQHAVEVSTRSEKRMSEDSSLSPQARRARAKQLARLNGGKGGSKSGA